MVFAVSDVGEMNETSGEYSMMVDHNSNIGPDGEGVFPARTSNEDLRRRVRRSVDEVERVE